MVPCVQGTMLRVAESGRNSPLRAAQLATLEERLGAKRYQARRVAVTDRSVAVSRARWSLQQFTQHAVTPVV